jgi:hypothetical protein
MRGEDTPIPMPLRGVDKTQAQSKQRRETTPDAENVRSVGGDKRMRLTQRPGMEKHYAYAMPGPVRVVATIVTANKSVTYEATEDEIESNGDGRTKHALEWKAFSSQKKDTRNVQVAPLSENVYTLSGNVIEKRNASGLVQWAFTVPVANKAFRLSPMAIGPDEAIHVAVDGGTSGSNGAAIYRVRQKELDLEGNTEPILEWEYRVDGWIRELKMDGGELKALVQFDAKRRSYVWTFGSIYTAIPQLTSSYPVPYPSTCMDIAADGSSYTGHPVYADRNTTPGKPGVGIPLVSWTPHELDNFEDRIWGWWDADDLAGFLDHDAEVTVWEDKSGNARDWGLGIPEQGAGVTRPGPTLNKKSSIEGATLAFNGKQGLFSKAGGGIFADRDSCLTALPNHGEAAWTMFILCRPSTATDPSEKDENGQPINERRFLINQFHHRTWGGLNMGTGGAIEVNGKNTRAFCTGIILNSTSEGVPNNDPDLYCWGRSDSIRGLPAPGYARPYTPSSGYRFKAAHDADGYAAGAWTMGVSNFDWPGMPLNRGAGKFGWPKEGQYADVTSTTESQGWCVMTLQYDGGLNEHYEVTGEIINGSIAAQFIPDDTLWLPGIPVATSGTVYIGSSSYSTATMSGGVLDLTAHTLTDGATTARIVFDRNLHSRCVWRINGNPIDRWEALPTAYTGPSDVGTTPTVADRELDYNVDLSQTGLGIPWALDKVKAYVGEIKEIIVFGNRTGAEGGVTLGSTTSYPYPTVMTHPKYAANAHTNDAAVPDQSWTGTGLNYLSTEMEKVEGYLMHKAGLQNKLQSPTASYPHPHYPGTALLKAHDVPLTTAFPSSGQAWIPRLRTPEAMLVKHDASGRMLWCLMAANVYGAGTNGDLFSEDLRGIGGVSGFTDAPATSGVAVGLDGDVFVVGPGSTASGGSQFCMGRIVDSPTTARNPGIFSVGWYASGTPFPPDTNKANFTADVTIRCVTDKFGNFYVPFPPGSQYDGGNALDAVRAYNPDGDLLFRLTTLNHGSSSYQNAYAVAFPNSTPDYNVSD